MWGIVSCVWSASKGMKWWVVQVEGLSNGVFKWRIIEKLKKHRAQKKIHTNQLWANQVSALTNNHSDYSTGSLKSWCGSPSLQCSESQANKGGGHHNKKQQSHTPGIYSPNLQIRPLWWGSMAHWSRRQQTEAVLRKHESEKKKKKVS